MTVCLLGMFEKYATNTYNKRLIPKLKPTLITKVTCETSHTKCTAVQTQWNHRSMLILKPMKQL